MLLFVSGRPAPLYACHVVPESVLLQAANLRHHKLFVPSNVWKCETLLWPIATLRGQGQSIRAGVGAHEPRFTGRSRRGWILVHSGRRRRERHGAKGKNKWLFCALGAAILGGERVTHEERESVSLHLSVFHVCCCVSPSAPERLHLHRHACVMFRASCQRKEWAPMFWRLSEKAERATKS